MIKELSYKPSFFENLDSFRLKFNFKIDKKEKIRTYLGAILTLFYILLVVSLFFSFGIDLYLRRNPRVSMNSKIEEYKENNFSYQNFTFAFRVEDKNGNILANNSIIYLEAAYFHYVMNENGIWEMIFGNMHPFRRCNELNYTKQKEEFYNISLASWYCLDFENIKMGGNWNGNFLYGLLINTKQCQNSKNPKCLQEEDLKKSFKDPVTGSQYFYSFLYMDALPEMDNYKNPLKLHLVNKYELLTLNTLKRSLQTYKKVQINNDKGWFLNDFEEHSFYSSDSLLSDFSLKEEFNEEIIYSHFIYFGNKIDIYNRSYTKIQEVIANIGGFSKIIYIILRYLYSFFGVYLKNIFLLKRINFELKDNNNNIDLLDKKVVTISNLKNFKKRSSQVNFLKKNDISNNFKNKFLHRNSHFNYSAENCNDEINFNPAINSNNLMNTNLQDFYKEDLNVGVKNLTINENINNIRIGNKKSQNYREKTLMGDLEKYSQKAINLKQHGLLVASNNKLESVSKKLGDSGNLVLLNQEGLEENRFHLNKPNDSMFNNEFTKKTPIFLNQKINIKDFENYRDKISSLKLMCGFLKPKKGTVHSRFGLHYYHYFVNYIDQTLNVFNFFKICNEYNNIKEILFENYTKKFSDIKPIIVFDEFELKSEAEHKNYNVNRFNSRNMDRIIANLLNKLDN